MVRDRWKEWALMASPSISCIIILHLITHFYSCCCNKICNGRILKGFTPLGLDFPLGLNIHGGDDDAKGK